MNDVYHLLSLLPPQCQCYCDDKADTPTSGFPVHVQHYVKALKKIYLRPAKPNKTTSALSSVFFFLLSYYSALLDITHNSE